MGDVFRLYLVRHAHAAWAIPGGSDFDRPLDAAGLAEARSVALQAYTAGFTPARIVSSPARRCAETTAAFLDVFGSLWAGYDQQLYSEGMEAYLEKIETFMDGESLMIVGHNPTIETLSKSLAAESEIGAGLAYGFPTAGFFALDFPRQATGRLTMHSGVPAALLMPALT